MAIIDPRKRLEAQRRRDEALQAGEGTAKKPEPSRRARAAKTEKKGG